MNSRTSNLVTAVAFLILLSIVGITLMYIPYTTLERGENLHELQDEMLTGIGVEMLGAAATAIAIVLIERYLTRAFFAEHKQELSDDKIAALTAEIAKINRMLQAQTKTAFGNSDK